MKVGKTGFAIKGLLILLVGILVDYLSGYLIAYFQYLTFYKIPGLELITEEFIKEPGTAYNVLVLGDDSKPVFEAIHEVYSNLVFHLVMLSLYAYFLMNYFTKSKRMEKHDASDYGSHGTARWANKKEIKELTKDDVGFILGEQNKKIVVHPSPFPENRTKLNQNVASFGGAGTGKTAGYAIPNILHNADVVGESLIITDPKGELFNKTSAYLKAKGYNILYFNLLDMSRSLRYNPLDYVTNTEEALSLANMIISNTEGKNTSGDSMWKNAEMAYFASLMMYLKETMPEDLQTIKSVLQLGTRIGADEELLDDMFSQLPEDSEAVEMYNIFRLAQDKTRAGILIGFGVRLKLWVSKNVANLTSTSDFDLNDLGMSKTALFLMIPDSDSTFDLIPALLLDQAFNVLYKQAGRNNTERLDVDVRCFLDELANIAAINDFERKVSTMRSRGISVVPIFQSITQFKNRYDKDRWSEILASSDTIVFLGTADKLTAEYFSKKLGNTTLLINSLSESSNGNGGSESKSHSMIGRALMTPDELERLEEDKVIIFQRGKKPMLLQKHFYFKQQKWSNIPKVNWYNEIKPRIDGKIKLIDPFGTYQTVAAAKEVEVTEGQEPFQPEKKDGYIADLLKAESESTVTESQEVEVAVEIVEVEPVNEEQAIDLTPSENLISDEENEPINEIESEVEEVHVEPEEIEIEVSIELEEDVSNEPEEEEIGFESDYLSQLMEDEDFKS